MVRRKGKSTTRYLCIVEGCYNSQAHRDEIKRHVISVHKGFHFQLHWKDAAVIEIHSGQTQAELQLLDLPARVNHDSCIGLACERPKTTERINQDSGKELAYERFDLPARVNYDSGKELAYERFDLPARVNYDSGKELTYERFDLPARVNHNSGKELTYERFDLPARVNHNSGKELTYERFDLPARINYDSGRELTYEHFDLPARINHDSGRELTYERFDLPARINHDSGRELTYEHFDLLARINHDSGRELTYERFDLPARVNHNSGRELTYERFDLPARVNHDSGKELDCDMDSRRGQREKKPSEKVKELLIGKKPDTSAEDPDRKYPPVYAADHVVVSADVKEVEKFYQHTKVTATGERYEFYALGNHLENKDRRIYIRAKQDPETLYFHAVEAPPCYARWSDEGHPLCAADNIENGFTKDMLTKTGEAGQHTTRANIFAREGQFFWEAKVVSTSPRANDNNHGVPLQTVDENDKSSCQRGSIKVGFARREQDMTLPIGFQAYSYCAMRTAGNKYGSVQHRQTMGSIIGKECPDGPQSGDVIGMMITLPSLEIHEQVVKGTYKPEDHPELSYGPVALKDLKTKPDAKKMGKSKSAHAKGKEKATDTPAPEHYRDSIRRQLYAEHGFTIPPTLDILRDRNPFHYKGNLVYFECPNYTPRPDLTNAESKGRTTNPETGKIYETLTDSHPCHELPWLRTLPGSKIEVWLNGEYLGIAWEHLLAFLPPASYIEKSARACQLYGDVDDGLLGYYPALTHYGGGTVEAKFDGPWWYGYDKATFPNARPFGERYQEQIVEDFISDVVDESHLAIKFGEGYMKAMVASKKKAEEPK